MRDKRYFVYIIGNKNQLKYPYNDCYIYFGSNYEEEWNRSSNADNKIGRVIRLYHLNFDENFMVIFFGTEGQCIEKYKELRPLSDMGLNDDYDEKLFRNKTNRYTTVAKKPYEMSRAEYKEWEKKQKEKKDNVHEPKEHNFKGKRNPRFVIWKLTDPDGNETIIESGIRNYCEEHNLSEFTLKDHLGEVIPPPKYRGENKKCNGYVARSDKLHERRLRTTGYKLERLTNKKPRFTTDWKRDAGIREYVNLRP